MSIFYKNSDYCSLCPRNCKKSRKNGDFGYCKLPDYVLVSRASLHLWEEPIISGKNGSGTVFFTGCNLKCVYCQNKPIIDGLNANHLTIKELADLFLRIENNKAHNINLVTPTPYIEKIIEAIKLAKSNGLKIPIVYNTSGYEKVEMIKILNKYIDIYLTDFKYYDNKLGIKYSNVNNYSDITKLALDEMFKDKNELLIKDNLLKKGIIVRILVLPNHYEDSKKIIKYLYEKYGDSIYISILSQYTPTKYIMENNDYNELKDRIKEKKYNEIINFALDLNIKNCYIQDMNVALESFIPYFNISPIPLK